MQERNSSINDVIHRRGFLSMDSTAEDASGEGPISAPSMSSDVSQEAADGTVPAQPGVIAHVAHVASSKGDDSEKGQGDSAALPSDSPVNSANGDVSVSREWDGSVRDLRQAPTDQERAHPVRLSRRHEPEELPETVTLLHTPDGGRVYVVGTAHFSLESQEDVAKVIEAVQPDAVVLELCYSRINILQYDEQTLLAEARDLNFDKVKRAVKQSGVIQGILHLLLLNMSAHLTKELGMAPGGEFRRALREALKVPGCQVHLGDRPIDVTLRRALGALTTWQKFKFAYAILTNKESITKEEVERLKKKDMLEEMLQEITGEFPALSRVFVKERDMYLARSLKFAGQPLPSAHTETGLTPAVTVGVVGIGHVAGIVEHWDQGDYDIRSLMKVPPPSMLGIASKYMLRAALVGVLAYGGYKMYGLGSYVCRWTSHTITEALA